MHDTYTFIMKLQNKIIENKLQNAVEQETGLVFLCIVRTALLR